MRGENIVENPNFLRLSERQAEFMNVRNCRKCKRLFNYVTGQVLCNACREEMEVKFQEVKMYIKDNPHSDIRQVAEDCDIDPMQIRQWIREERLCFSDDSPIGIACERCGKTIRTGRFCEQCKAEMTNGLNQAMSSTPRSSAPVRKDTRNNPRMHYLD